MVIKSHHLVVTSTSTSRIAPSPAALQAHTGDRCEGALESNNARLASRFTLLTASVGTDGINYARRIHHTARRQRQCADGATHGLREGITARQAIVCTRNAGSSPIAFNADPTLIEHWSILV